MAVKAKRREVDTGLNINSMMDMMTIILVFLLKSYSTTDVSVSPSEALTLPISSAMKAPEVAVNLVVEKGQVIVDGRPVMQLNDKAENASSPGRTTVDFMDGQLEGQLVTDLFQVLEQKADAAKDLGVKSGNAELEFKGRILMQVDKDIPFSVLRSVMYTAGQAEFGEFRFVVIKADG